MSEVMKASWLNSLYDSLAITLPAKGIITNIDDKSVNVGDVIDSDDIDQFISSVNNLKNQEFLQYINWDAYNIIRTNIAQTSLKTNVDNLMVELTTTVNGNYAKTASNANTAHTNMTGNNVSTCTEENTGGNSKTCTKTSHNNSFSQSFSGNNVSTNSNTATNSQTFSGNANTNTQENCTNNTKYSTFTAFQTNNGQGTFNSGVKSANQGVGFDASASNSKHATESNRSCSESASNSKTCTDQSNRSCNRTLTTEDSVSFSNKKNTNFTQSYVNMENETSAGGNAKTCNTFIANFSVLVDGGTVTNSNIVP